MTFETRYPELLFLLSITPFDAFTLTEDRKNAFRKEKEEFFYLHVSQVNELKKLPLNKIQTLYYYGLGLGHIYFLLKDWLHANANRDLIFIEDDLAVVDAFYRSGNADEILSDPQVHIRFLLEKKRMQAFLKECAQDFPSENIEVACLLSYQKKWPSKCRKIRLGLLRKTTVEEALFFEDVFYPELLKNLIHNFKRWPNSFWAKGLKDIAKGIPAIVCGAGPSLEKNKDALKKLHHKAIILGGGSTISALTKLEIMPHFAMAIDPNPEEYRCLKPAVAFECPFLYGSRLLPESFYLLNGPYGYLSTKTGGSAEKWMEEKCNFDQESLYDGICDEALSITTTCISFAAYLGANPIVLVGVDLSFTGDKHYAANLSGKISASGLERDMRNSERLLRRKDRNGKSVFTNIKWIMEANWIHEFAKAHEKITFIDAREGGIPIKGIPYKSLEEIELQCKDVLDLKSLIYTELSAYSLKEKDTDIQKSLKKLKKSLNGCLKHIQDINLLLKDETIDEKNPLLLVYELDLNAELAYEVLLVYTEKALASLLKKQFRKEEEMGVLLRKKWEKMQSLTQSLMRRF